MISRNFNALQIVYKPPPFKLHPEDGFMKAETCSCYVPLINYILHNIVALDYKFIYFINHQLRPDSQKVYITATKKPADKCCAIPTIIRANKHTERSHGSFQWWT